MMHLEKNQKKIQQLENVLVELFTTFSSSIVFIQPILCFH